MKKIVFSRFLGLIALGTALGAASCEQEEPTYSTEQTQFSTENHTRINTVIEDVAFLVEEALALNTDVAQPGVSLSNGATVTINNNADNSGSVLIDFGSGQTFGGKTHAGVIRFTYNRPWYTFTPISPGVLASGQDITFQNYSINGRAITGGLLREWTGVDGNDRDTITVRIRASSFAMAVEGGKIEVSGLRTRRYFSKATPDISDDEVEVQGTLSGSNPNFIAYTATIADAARLIVSRACATQGGAVPMKGQVVVTPQSTYPYRQAAYLNYGDGQCDKEASYVWERGQNTKTIALE